MVYAAFEGDHDINVVSASLSPPTEYVDCERDDRIKEWGICVGLAYAVAASEERFGGLGAAGDFAEEIAREVWAVLHPPPESGGN
jgi:hypothetical protein